MAEYIKREALLRWIEEFGPANKSAVINAPAADVEPVVHGKWKYIRGDEFSETYQCSRCEKEVTICVEIMTEELPTRCPSCGAKMGEAR